MYLYTIRKKSNLCQPNSFSVRMVPLFDIVPKGFPVLKPFSIIVMGSNKPNRGLTDVLLSDFSMATEAVLPDRWVNSQLVTIGPMASTTCNLRRIQPLLLTIR